jgi:transketolase
LTIQIELWALLTFLVGLLITFLGAVFGGGKILLGQVEKRLDERFAAQEKSRIEAQKHWDTKFAAIERDGREEANQWQRIERELLSLKADLPVQYVRREDYVRNQTVIEAKLDAVALKIENLQLRGATHA